MKPTLEALNLSKRYGSFTALDNLNLKIEGAKCVGFLGPNGAGKTTALKIFTDLIRPSKGSALVNGVNVHVNKKIALERVSALIETPEIYQSLTPREALGFVAELRGIPRDVRTMKIEEALHTVQMDEWVDKKVGKFSKGMKQRVVLASILLDDPEIIILDEPTSGLDPRGMSEVRDVVKSLKSKNRLIFMSSHLLNEVSDICDEVAMIDHGRLLVYDTLENVTSRFSGKGSTSVVEIGFFRPVDEAIFKKIETIPSVLSLEQIDSRNIRVKLESGVENQERLQEELVLMKIGMISFKPSSSALEDTYLNLIRDTV